MGNLSAVGIGPGNENAMTGEALAVLEKADIIVGYTLYTELLKKIFPHKEYLSTGMRQEKERCREAVRRAAEGRNVAVVSSGDSGVYGMAGLLLETLEEMPEQMENTDFQVIPGLTAALSGAALLGAPLTHDFAVISLSDILTAWEKIEKRLCAACRADLSIVLYNPISRRRTETFRRACGILREELPGDRLAGLVRNIGRDGETHRILRLDALEEAGLSGEIDMLTTVFIGNSETRMSGGRWMLTPRGYHL